MKTNSMPPSISNTHHKIGCLLKDLPKNISMFYSDHRVLSIIFLIQAIVAIGVFTHIITAEPFSEVYTPSDLIINTDSIDWTEVLDDGGILVEGNSNGSLDPFDAISLDNVHLNPGRYRIIVDSSQNNSYLECTNYLHYSSDSLYIDNELALDSSFSPTPAQSEFHISKAIDDFKFTVFLDPNCTGLAVRSISIVRVSRIYLVLSHLLPLILIDVALILLFTNIITKTYMQKLSILVLILIVLISSAPLMLNYIPTSVQGGTHDLEFHLKRIVMLANDCGKTFPVRMHPDAFYGYGGIFPVFYGELLLYIPALMIRLGFPVWLSYNYYILFINIITVLVSFLVMYGISKSIPGSLTGSFLYVCNPYRLTIIYVFSRLGEYSAWAFVPLICFACWLISTGDNSVHKSRVWLFFLIGGTGLLHTHTLTTEICLAACIIFFVICHRNILSNKENLLQLFGGAFSLLLLNLWFIVPFVSIYSKNILNINVVNTSPEGLGVSPLQLFSIISPGWGSIRRYTMVNNTGQILGIASGIILLTIICLTIVYNNPSTKVDLKHKNSLIIMGIISGIFIFAASTYMPWNYFLRFGLENIFFSIQFPGRLLVVPAILLSISCSLIYPSLCNAKIDIKIMSGFLIILCLINCVTVSSQYVNLFYTGEEIKIISIDDKKWLLDALYLPRGNVSTYNSKVKYLGRNIDGIQTNSDDVIVNHLQYTDNGNSLAFYASNSSHQDMEVILPKYYYPVYTSFCDDDRTLTPKMYEDGRLSVNIPGDYTGKVVVRYAIPIIWRICDFCSLVFTILLVFYCVHRRIRK